MQEMSHDEIPAQLFQSPLPDLPDKETAAKEQKQTAPMQVLKLHLLPHRLEIVNMENKDMSDSLSYESRVVVVTGAGNGLGRAYAHEFARRGAKVVVNDYGTALDGIGSDPSPADRVVAEIQADGGEAVPNCESVLDGDKVIQTALDSWGRIDVLINNAGISYPKSFARMTKELWDRMIDVHLNGSYSCSYAAWPIMQAQNYGRILFTSSPFGLHSYANQAHYSAAKAGTIGMARALSLEGREQNIFSNVVAPYSASRMTGIAAEQENDNVMSPYHLAQLAVWLTHESCEENGSIFEAGGGVIHKVRWALGQPLHFEGTDYTAESIADAQELMNDFSDNIYPNPGECNTTASAATGGNLRMLGMLVAETS